MRQPADILKENGQLCRRLQKAEDVLRAFRLGDADGAGDHDGASASERLRVSEIRYRRLFEAAHDGILIVDPQSREIIDANPFMIKLLGYSLAELIGMEIFEIGLFSDAQANKDMFEILKATGQIRYENLPFQTQDGVLRDVEVVANRYDENGHSVIQFNIRDTTERAREEAERAAAEKRLYVDAARRDMLGVLGHEMRTPVLSALAAIEMFPDGLKAQDPRNYLGLAEKGLKVLQSLIDDVLDLARLDAGEFRIENAPFGLADLLEEVADIMAPLATRHRLVFKRDWPSDPVLVLGDGARLRQILINLLSNAFRYTREGQVTLSGSWQPEQDHACHLRLSITDTGRGISDDQIKEIFKPFFRAEQGLGDRVKGLGLGLPITERLAHALGGRIEVVSQVGHGSTFSLVVDLPMAPVALQTLAQSNEWERSGLLAEKSVLVVEDSVLQAEMLMAVLQTLGAKTETVSMGRDAIEAVKHRTFDVILIDLGLPDMTGADLVRQLHEEGSSAVHVALSANPGSLTKSESALFDASATKATSKKELGRLLVTVLKTRLTEPRELAAISASPSDA